MMEVVLAVVSMVAFFVIFVGVTAKLHMSVHESLAHTDTQDAFDDCARLMGLSIRPETGRAEGTFRKVPYAVFVDEPSPDSRRLPNLVMETSLDGWALDPDTLEAFGPDTRETWKALSDLKVDVHVTPSRVAATLPRNARVQTTTLPVQGSYRLLPSDEDLLAIRAHLIAIRRSILQNADPGENLYALATDPRSAPETVWEAAQRIITTYPDHWALEMLLDGRAGLRTEARIAVALCACRSRDELLDAFHDAARLNHDTSARCAAIPLYLELFPWHALHDDALRVLVRARIARAALDAAPDDHEDDLVSLVLGLSHRLDGDGRLLGALLDHGWDPSPEVLPTLARRANATQLQAIVSHVEARGPTDAHAAFAREVHLRNLSPDVRFDPELWGVVVSNEGQLSLVSDDATRGALTASADAHGLSLVDEVES